MHYFYVHAPFSWHDVIPMYDCLCHCINFLISVFTGLYLRVWTTSVWSCTRVFACARHLVSSYVLARLFSDNPGPSCPCSEAQRKRGGILLWKTWTSSRSIRLVVAHSWPVSFDQFARFPFVVCVYLSVLFILCNHTLRLFDVILDYTPW